MEESRQMTKKSNAFRIFSTFQSSVLGCVICGVVSAAEAPPELGILKSRFEEATAELYEPIRKLKQGYSESLQKLLSQVTAAGDLEKVIAVKAEISLISETGGERQGASFPELRRLQDIYDEQLELRTKEADSRLEPLRADYRQKLNGLQVDLTRNQRIDEALVVKAEIDSVVSGGESPKTDVPTASGEVDIPEGTLELDGHHYFLFKVPPRNWEEARVFCEKRGGHLAIIETRKELAALSKLRVSTLGEKSWAWVGGTMPEGEDRWKWIDGSPVSERDPWSNKQEFEVPHPEERYLVFGPDDKYSGYRIESGFVNGFICEWSDE